MDDTTAHSQITVHAPDSNTLDNFDFESFMGTWFVTHSTLPLWKNKKDVTITYTPITTSSQSPPSQFNDIVEFRSQKSPPTAKRTRIEGVDTLNSSVSPSSSSSPPAHFKWRGKGLLMISSSKWQVLGYGKEENGWAVTFFEKTIFTPAGLDIYSRTQQGLTDALLTEIMEKAKQVGGQVGSLAGQFFEVPRSMDVTS